MDVLMRYLSENLLGNPTPQDFFLKANAWKEWCIVGTWPCLCELRGTTTHRTHGCEGAVRGPDK